MYDAKTVFKKTIQKHNQGKYWFINILFVDDMDCDNSGADKIIMLHKQLDSENKSILWGESPTGITYSNF